MAKKKPPVQGTGLNPVEKASGVQQNTKNKKSSEKKKQKTNDLGRRRILVSYTVYNYSVDFCL